MKERKAPRKEDLPQPESEAWKTIPWRKLERHVFRIQKRIYRASQQGKTRTVQKLQKLLMKSEAARRFCQNSNLILLRGSRFVMLISPENGTRSMANELSPLHRHENEKTSEENQTGVFDILLSGMPVCF